MGALISTEEPARSVSGVEALLAKHNEQKAEIEAREDSVAQVTKVGRRQIQQGHYASTEVRERERERERETERERERERERDCYEYACTKCFPRMHVQYCRCAVVVSW